jgi:hypothetical protein
LLSLFSRFSAIIVHTGLLDGFTEVPIIMVNLAVALGLLLLLTLPNKMLSLGEKWFACANLGTRAVLAYLSFHAVLRLLELHLTSFHLSFAVLFTALIGLVSLAVREWAGLVLAPYAFPILGLFSTAIYILLHGWYSPKVGGRAVI